MNGDTWRTLKDMPGVKAGAKGLEHSGDILITSEQFGSMNYPVAFAKKCPEFFEQVQACEECGQIDCICLDVYYDACVIQRDREAVIKLIKHCRELEAEIAERDKK